MKVKVSQLRRIIKEEISRLFEYADPEVIAKDGKIQVTAGNQMFDFSPDQVKLLFTKKGAYVKSDDYDDDKEDGCELRRESGKIMLAVHKGGNTVLNDSLDEDDVKKALAGS